MSTEQLALFPLGIDMTALRRSRELFEARAVPEATRLAYEFDWKDFSGWCLAAGRESMPAVSETVELYLVASAQRGLAVSTLQRRIWGIARAHKIAHYPTPIGPGVWSMVAAIARQLGREQRRVKALTADQVSRMAATLPTHTAAGLRYRAALLLGFSTGLRCSSLAALLLDDVQVEGRGLMVSVGRSKSDQEGRGHQIGVSSAEVIAAVDAWVQRRGLTPGRLFRCSVESLRQCVKSGCVRIGLDPSEYSTHSLRAGMITALDAAGVSLPAIMERSGHKSVQVALRYVRHRQAFAHDPLALVVKSVA